jgi:ABC-type multidrug transport system fused ATPase/permease subunit
MVHAPKSRQAGHALPMEHSIFKYILRHSAPQQFYLLAVTVGYYPFLYISLELPKVIVNQAIEAGPVPPYTLKIFGLEQSLDLPQIWFLMALCFAWLLVFLVNGGFKYHINIYKGLLGEGLLRGLRRELYSRMLRFPLPRFRRLGQGEVIPIITAEVEPLGGFIGTAFADPMFYGGQLVIILSFILIQDPLLGLAAIAFYPLQLYLIPKLQRRINSLAKRRVRNVRRLSDHIGETVSGIVEVRANDTADLEMARFDARLGRIYGIRYQIYRRKFFIKFLNNFIDKLTPFFFLSIGGYLVIQGDLTLGALLAVLAAYKDLGAPWREMLLWYQQKEDIRVKYEQIIEQFDSGDIPAEPPDPAEADFALTGNIEVNVSLTDENGFRVLDNAAMTLPLAAHTAIVGDSASGKAELALLLAGLDRPGSGTVMIDGRDIADLPVSVTGRRIGYVDPHAKLQNASIGENLVYGLKRRPRALDMDVDADAVTAALDPGQDDAPPPTPANGHLPFGPRGDWIDYAAAGVDGADALGKRIVEVLRIVEFARDVYQMGLRSRLNPVAQPEIAARILDARESMRARLRASSMTALVEPFDVARYNGNATVGENLLFGVPRDERFRMDELAEHPYMRSVLDRFALTGDFIEIGRRLAEIMVELFADLPPGHEYFEQFSFVSAEELPAYRTIIRRAARGAQLSDEQRQQLLALSFMLVTERHRLGLIDSTVQERILAARRAFRAELPDSLQDAIAFFDSARYNPAATIQDNILFGRLAYGHAYGERQIGYMMEQILDELELREAVTAAGLRYPAGIGGARLSHSQRQKLVLARALLKRPDLLIVNEAAEAFDQQSQARIIEHVRGDLAGRGLVWVTNAAESARYFERIVVMKHGRIIDQGDYEMLARPGGPLYKPLQYA